MMFAGAMAVAMAVDAAYGWPEGWYARVGHPVTWIGRMIRFADDELNEGTDLALRRRRGVVATIAVVAVTMGVALAVQSALPGGWLGAALTGILAWPFLAIRSLHDHVAAVARPLMLGNLEGARSAVAMIVGRDPARLDQAGVARAGLESLAENASDGIVAPLFWGLLLGLPGIAGYKAVNTLDSMIGHRTPRHEAFGWFAARLDDWVNLIPARLTGLAFALASGVPDAAWATMRRDARRHRSPNAGWPEAALAGALGIRLSGPRAYADRVADEPWVNAAAPDPGAADMERGLALYRRAMWGIGIAVALLAVLW